jgi:hypothetical protein
MNSNWKWEQLRLLIEGTLAHNVQYSHDKAFDRYSYQRVLEWMDSLDKRAEEKKTAEPDRRIPEPPSEGGFIFTGIPTFDQKAWEEILERKGLQGLS